MATNTPVVAAAVLAGLLTCAVRADAQVGVIAGAARSTIAFGAPDQDRQN